MEYFSFLSNQTGCNSARQAKAVPEALQTFVYCTQAEEILKANLKARQHTKDAAPYEEKKKRKSQTGLQRPPGHYHTSLTHIGHSGRGGPARVRSLAEDFAGRRKTSSALVKEVKHLPLSRAKAGAPFGFSRLKRIESARKSKNGRATKRHHSRKDCVHEATSRVDVVERLLRFLTDAPEDETGVTNNGRNAAAITGRASPCKSDGGIESWQGGAEGGGTVR